MSKRRSKPVGAHETGRILDARLSLVLTSPGTNEELAEWMVSKLTGAPLPEGHPFIDRPPVLKHYPDISGGGMAMTTNGLQEILRDVRAASSQSRPPYLPQRNSRYLPPSEREDVLSG